MSPANRYPGPSALAPVYDRPRLPDIEDLHRAQVALNDADAAGCSDAEYDRLALVRQQTETAYIAGADRMQARDMPARAGFFDADAMAARLLAGETPVLRTGPPVFGTLAAWMAADGELPSEALDLDPPELPEAGQ